MEPTLRKRFLLAVIFAILSASCLIDAAAAERTPVEVLYISNKFVFPTHITRPQGQFLIVIKNQSNLTHLVLHIKKNDSDADIVLADMDEEDGRYEALLDLDPGAYKLLDPSHPELICTLAITQ
jgi:hypothetical protein